jgi:pantothenate kinase-related protein Tda10
MISFNVKQWRSEDQTKLEKFVIPDVQCDNHVQAFIAFYKKKYYKYMRKEKRKEAKEKRKV